MVAKASRSVNRFARQNNARLKKGRTQAGRGQSDREEFVPDREDKWPETLLASDELVNLVCAPRREAQVCTEPLLQMYQKLLSQPQQITSPGSTLGG